MSGSRTLKGAVLGNSAFYRANQRQGIDAGDNALIDLLALAHPLA